MTPDLPMRLAQRDRPSGWPVLAMRWEALLFLHWNWDPAEIQKTLPEGLQVDTFDGAAWLAVVPFFMRRVHPRGLPCVPWLSDFLEFNVRTYVTDRNGVPGVWFYSLLCDQPIAVEVARKFFHLNYLHARLAATDAAGNSAHFSWDERGHGLAHFHGRETGGFATAPPGSLEFFLVERYVLFSTDRRGRIHAGRVHHAPYEIAAASVERWSFRPAASLGFSDPQRAPDHTLIARPVQVDAWPIRRVSFPGQGGFAKTGLAGAVGNLPLTHKIVATALRRRVPLLKRPDNRSGAKIACPQDSPKGGKASKAGRLQGF